ncbi:MAG: sulfur carrier protein ThiS [Sedimentibacter sp.]
MIKVNNRDFQWEHGMTVEDILKLKNYTWKKIIVKVNGIHVEEEDYKVTVINDGDDVQMLHLLAGG